MFIIYKQYINVQYQVYKNIHGIRYQLFLVGMMKKYENGKCQKDTQAREQKILCFSPCVFDREDEKFEGYKINYYHVLIIKSKRLKRQGNFVLLFLIIIIFSHFFFHLNLEVKKWWVLVENSKRPIFFPFNFHSIQTMKNHIFLSFIFPYFPSYFF